MELTLLDIRAVAALPIGRGEHAGHAGSCGLAYVALNQRLEGEEKQQKGDFEAGL